MDLPHLLPEVRHLMVPMEEGTLPDVTTRLVVWPISSSRTLHNSWHRGEKSSKSYHSLFKRWVSWCQERDSDPISAPVSEVVNFLAGLHDKGYSYHSLNAYRSVISSTHDTVRSVNTHWCAVLCWECSILTLLNPDTLVHRKSMCSLTTLRAYAQI